MDDREHSEAVFVAASPQALYAMISDVTRMGEWSPICTACWWDDGDGPRVGAWFTGRNVTPEKTWETRSQVVVADPGREFAFQLRGNWTRWGYTFESVHGGTRLTESWHFPPAAVAGFRERFGEAADARLEIHTQQMREGIPATLAAIKAAAEDIKTFG
ncbi:MAG: SRPBCC family protein [Pseudonocardiaceae bacterium]